MESMNNRKRKLIALMDMFVAIKKLSKGYQSYDHAVDALDLYFKTNDPRYITTFGGIRDFVLESNIRNEIFPLIDGKYDHLDDFIKSLLQKEEKRKNK